MLLGSISNTVTLLHEDFITNLLFSPTRQDKIKVGDFRMRFFFGLLPGSLATTVVNVFISVPSF